MMLTSDVTTEENVVETNDSFLSIIAGFFIEFYGLLKYIFHDVWLGKPPV